MIFKYLFWGKIIKGKDRGKKLGFPTANIRLHKNIPEGVYISEVFISHNKYSAATFIGPAKTYGELDYKAESYILDFENNIYRKWITVRLIQKLRGNIKFDSPQALTKQIKQDVLMTRRFFQNNI
jgi:riboflavin kinase / FMN adenylyltransferase